MVALGLTRIECRKCRTQSKKQFNVMLDNLINVVFISNKVSNHDASKKKKFEYIYATTDYLIK